MMTTKEVSSKQESLVAKALGWKVTSGSGARAFHVGDVYCDSWIGECKTHETPNNPIVFKHATWDKIRDEAMSQFKSAVLFVDDGSQSLSNTWCMTDWIDDTQIIVHPVDAKYIHKSSVSFKLSDANPYMAYYVTIPGRPRRYILSFDRFAKMISGD